MKLQWLFSTGSDVETLTRATTRHTSMELDSDKYDVVVIGTGFAESIAAA